MTKTRRKKKDTKINVHGLVTSELSAHVSSLCVCILIFIDDEMKEKTFLEVGEDWEKDVTEVEFFFLTRKKNIKMCERLTEIFM